MSFGVRLHELRIRNSMSLQNVATAIGISKAHVWNMEKGTSDNPSIELVIKLVDHLPQCPAEDVDESLEGLEEAYSELE
ncbi:MAG: XRE family transcriptional regulator [Myxococcaceae bacterium]|nr:MAG: XRE family transcriptional regulator [Myxococcaceae bacterium]